MQDLAMSQYVAKFVRLLQTVSHLSVLGGVVELLEKLDPASQASGLNQAKENFFVVSGDSKAEGKPEGQHTVRYGHRVQIGASLHLKLCGRACHYHPAYVAA